MTRSHSAGGRVRMGRAASRYRYTSPTPRCVPPPRTRTSRPTSPNTRATWATTATRWTGGTAGPRSWCGRWTGRSRRAPRPGRSGRCRNWAPASRPETWRGHVLARSRSRRSGKRSDRRPDCWARRERLSSPLVRLREAADHELRDEIVAALGGYGDNVLGCLMPALRSAAALPADARRAAGLDVVARDCGQRLGAVIARPLRDEDDGSIGWTGCGCDLADPLGTVLGS